MGKRELLIVIGFVALGAVAYRLSAPPPKEGTGFSVRKLIDEIRADIRSDAESATYAHDGSLAVPTAIDELRISGITGRLMVTGEDRSDVAYALQVESTGPDTATATEYAKRTVLVEDDLGNAVGLRVSYPAEGRQSTAIELKVPKRLRISVEGSGAGNSFELRNLHAVRLEGVVGEVTAEQVAGEVSGSHRNGRLTVTDARSVTLSLQSSRALFTKVEGPIRLNASRGEARIAESNGAIEIEQSGTEVRIDRHAAPLRVSGSGGSIEIIEPKAEVRIDVRRTEVAIELSAAVPMTVITSDEPLRLTLADAPAILLDAIITGDGAIVAEDFGLAGVTGQDQVELSHAFVTGATTRVSLRNRRDDIVIRKRK